MPSVAVLRRAASLDLLSELKVGKADDLVRHCMEDLHST